MYTGCPANTSCKASYCGGCFSQCTADCPPRHATGGRPCPPSPTPANPQCPPGAPQVYCLVDPCTVPTNPCKDNSTVCQSNYCGGCNAACVPKCKPGVPLVECLVNPCTSNPCPPRKKCVPDYCGGCRAKCVRGEQASTAGSSASRAADMQRLC